MMTQSQEAAIACAYADLIGILQAYEAGSSIAELDIDSLTSTVEDIEKEFPKLCAADVPDEADPGEMDGDEASALASAGLGTDEDYGADEQL